MDLAVELQRLCPTDGSHATVVPNVFLNRSSTRHAPRTSLTSAVFCVVAQGAKSILLDGDRLVYDPEHYLIASIALPLTGQIERASHLHPYLGLSIVLDFQEISDLLQQPSPTVLADNADRGRALGIAVGAMNADLQDAVLRLARLLHTPGDAATLAPLILREIHYRLLVGEHGPTLRRLAAGSNGQAKRVAAGLDYLRTHRAGTVRMADLARVMHMSASGMHAAIRSVTGLSPLQFQKQLRLQDARQLMLAEQLDAATAAERVGYRSVSQFTREYGRFFGAPPMRDIGRLRGSTVALAA